MNIEELVKEGIKESEIRHKKRLSEIAMGITGRHKNILKFYSILKQSLKDYDYYYLIYLPCMPKSSAEIVSILSKRENEPEVITPISYKEVFDKIKKLNVLFANNKELCSNCELASDKCEFYHGSFNITEMRWKDEAVIIGDLLAEFIQLSEMPRTYVFIKMLRIPQDSVLSPLPNSKIYTGLIIVTGEPALSSISEILCNKIQISYRNLLNNLERNLKSCTWENLDMIDIQKESKELDYRNKLESSSLPSFPEKNHSIRVNSDGITSTIGTHVVNNNQYEGCEIIAGDKIETRGQVAAIGRHSHAHNMNWNQLWLQSEEKIELNNLANELETLRSKMHQEATTPQQDILISEVANAQIAAKARNGAKAMEHLNAAGKWALSCAEKISLPVATAAIKAALGL